MEKANSPLDQITKGDIDKLRLELMKLNETTRIQNRYYRKRNIIFRSFMIGTFTALGATIGFSLVVIMTGKFVQSASKVPILSDLLEKTNITVIFNNQLDQLSHIGDPTVTPTAEVKPTEVITPTEVETTAAPTPTVAVTQ